MSTEDRDRKVTEVTFHSVPEQYDQPWGWKIPQNPEREPGTFTEAEREVTRLAKDNTP